jgi:hypothetical protein
MQTEENEAEDCDQKDQASDYASCNCANIGFAATGGARW